MAEVSLSCVICGNDDLGRVCAGCRRYLARQIGELPELLADAVTLTLPMISGVEWVRHTGAGWVKTTVRHTVSAGPVTVGSRLRISGTRAKALPVALELLNVVGPGATAVTDPYRDQVGELPVAVWLREQADDWAELRGWAHLTEAHVTNVAWLCRRLTAWLDWACDHHPTVTDFADELGRQRSILRYAAGVVLPEPEHCVGVPCRRCDLRSLWRHDGRVTCAACGTILEMEDYDRHVRATVKAM